MNLFGKSKRADTPPVQTGRQRPVSNDSSRPQAFSYHTQRSGSSVNTGRGQVEPDIDTKRSITAAWTNNRLSMLGGGVLIVGLLGYMLTLTPSPKVVLKTTSDSAYFVQDAEAYQKTAAHSLSGSLFNRNKITVDTAKVEQDIKKNYPEVAKATVTAPLFGQKPVVTIEPYRPSFILTTTSSAAFLLDENGRALISTSQIAQSGELSVPTLQDKTDLQVKLGAQVLSGGTIRFIQEVLAILKASGVEYGVLSLPAGTSELDVAIKDKPYLVKFNLQGDARLQAGTLIATKLRLEKDRITPGQYVDVRVADRAYYR
ncbi:MAG: hypothetical protein JWP13_76 [Candidatus Saccharibacteria bacterium]|nr:hypothetical protein [Candidatus Saccharibacteria bacterium]